MPSMIRRDRIGILIGTNTGAISLLTNDSNDPLSVVKRETGDALAGAKTIAEQRKALATFYLEMAEFLDNWKDGDA